MKEGVYGLGKGSRAWQVCVGCDPRMPCAPRCWARRTVARIVECQKPTIPERAAFYQIALTPDGQKWSGKTFLDEAHLLDPIKWRKPALIATGFHGDWGRLEAADMDRMLAVMALCPHHQFMPLTKQPSAIVEYFRNATDVRRRVAECLLTLPGNSNIWRKALGVEVRNAVAEGILYGWRPLVSEKTTFGCSMMNQAESDKYRPSMKALEMMGLRTHVWYEPATGPVDWKGWEFLTFVISGGESGAQARPSDPQWHRDTRDFCQAHGITYNFKQWGEWGPSAGKCYYKGPIPEFRAANEMGLVRLGKRLAGRELDGRTWDGEPFPKRDAILIRFRPPV